MTNELNDQQLDEISGGSEIVVTKQIDATTPALLNASVGGTSIESWGEKTIAAFRLRFFS
jgi:hypothetical protein